ncbi:MAG: transglycosylase domain-containing protein [Polyangiaceae bacterium]|nr:transglycosylase domain-containing protein [Polyangiaceae bacterium]
MASAHLKVALAAGGVIAVATALSFGPLVRHQAARTAARYGASITIDEVRPSWHGVKLHGVDVAVADIPSSVVHFESIDIAVGWSGKKVALQGGTVSAVGSREVVLHEVEQWQTRYLRTASSKSEPSTRSHTEAEIVGLRLSWQNTRDNPTEAVNAVDVNFARQDGKVGLSAKEATITVGPLSVSAEGGHITLVKHAEGGYRVAALSARALDAALTLPGPLDDARLPAHAPASTEPAEHVPRAWTTARATLVRGAHVLDAALEQGANIKLDSLHAKVSRGRESLNLGPGSLAVRRDSGRMLIELSPHARDKDDAQALTFSLSVPLTDAAAEIVADVQGGPIFLSALGIREGDFGLIDVTKTSLTTRSHVVLSADGKELRIDGQGRAQNLSFQSRSLSDDPITGLDVAFRLKGQMMLDGSSLRVDDGEVDVGATRLSVRGTYQRSASGGGHRVRAEFEVPLTACQSMLEAAPKALVPHLVGMRMAGSFALKGHARFDTARIDHDYDVAWDLSNTCRIAEAPAGIDAARFRKPFRRWVVGPAGERVEVESGPGTAGWVPFGAISPFMQTAVLTTEDSSFRHHGGFDMEAIRNSIRDNLRKGKFVRGASTLSMQLAKNLYLDRGKTVSRKLQEVVLTTYLEQELTKDQILELYLNVVEFGPMIYGIGPAARYYFNTSASDLSLGQALYISSILPNPKQQHFGVGGEVTPGWMNFIRKLMQTAHKRQWITDEELETGLRETVVRGQPAPKRADAPPPEETNAAPPEGDLERPGDF